MSIRQSPDESYSDLRSVVDAFDGEIGKDVTGLEAGIFGKVMDLSPDKQRVAADRMRKLSECNAAIASCRGKIDLLSGMSEQSELFDILSALERKKLRIIRFAELSEGRNPKSASDKQKNDVSELLRGREGMDALSNSTVLSLKKRGADLSKLFLVPEDDAFGLVSRETIAVGRAYVVNFGSNPSLNEKLGAGDILPYEVSKISVDGVEGIRKTSPRPGFYAKGADGREKYLPIFDKTKVSILAVGPLNEEELRSHAEADEARWKNMRMAEMVMNNQGEALSSLEDDLALVEEAKKAYAEIGEVREKYAAYVDFREVDFRREFGETVEAECAKYGLPADKWIRMCKKESGFNPWIRNGMGSSAYGLGQIIDDTWNDIKNKMPGGWALNRHDPKDQIAASVFYLNQMKEVAVARGLPGDPWDNAVVLYHTGPGFSEEHLADAMSKNPSIAGKMRERSVEAYVAAARNYYFG